MLRSIKKNSLNLRRNANENINKISSSMDGSKKIIKRNKNIVIILNKLKCIILYIRLKYK